LYPDWLANGKHHPPRGCGKPPSLQDPLKAREAAIFARDSAVGCMWG